MEIHDIRVGKTYVDDKGNRREVIGTIIRCGENGLEAEVSTIVTVANGKSFESTETKMSEIETWTEFVPSMMTNEEIIQKFAEAAVRSKRLLKISRCFIAKIAPFLDKEMFNEAMSISGDIAKVTEPK